MNLTIKDIAELLNVSEKTIYRMIQNETIPCFKVGKQWRFDKREIVSWIEDTRAFPRKAAEEDSSIEDEEIISIAEFIYRGGVYYNIPAGDKKAVIQVCLERVQARITSLDTQKFLGLIMDRENLCSTAVGHGIALPHPRTFGTFTDISYIALCHLDAPMPFGALDNEDVNTLFFIFPKSERRFLRIQSTLLRLLRDDEVLSTIKQASSQEIVYETLLRKETQIFARPLL